MNGLHLATILAISSALSACDGMQEAMTGTSFRDAQEQRQALAMPMVPVVAVAAVDIAVPVLPVALVSAPLPLAEPAPEPPCQPVYRVWACVDGVRVEL